MESPTQLENLVLLSKWWQTKSAQDAYDRARQKKQEQLSRFLDARKARQEQLARDVELWEQQ